MKNKELNTETRIFVEAYHTFILYGYHGTTLRQIAIRTGVRTSMIHYYFRSKNGLYKAVVEEVLNSTSNMRFGLPKHEKKLNELRWFLYTELHNNKDLFYNTLKNLYPDDWEIKLNNIKSWLESPKTWNEFN